MKKCSYSEFFWSVFSRIRTEYGERQSISSRIEMFDKALNTLLKSTSTITTTAAN